LQRPAGGLTGKIFLAASNWTMHNASGAPTESSLKMPPVLRVRAHYASLCAIAAAHFTVASLAGCLLLVDNLSDEGDALLIAASIAGATSLVVESRTEMVHYSVRNGIVDFAVSTLDDALRILKDEIRKRQPVAVLLERQPVNVLAEMAERGAQPDLLRWASLDPAMRPYLEKFRKRGARPFPAPEELKLDPAHEVCWRAEGSTALRQLDLLASQILPQDDFARQNWVARAPRYMPRAFRLERRVQMTPEESTAFLAAIEERAQHSALAGRVSIEAGTRMHSFGV
jgi:Urocanase Rossmann-like domain